MPSLPGVSGRDASILGELARSDESALAFSGLRRRLGLHQQALARSLRRLEREGYVQRTGDGYRLSERGFGAVGDRTVSVRPDAAPAPLAQARLPDHVGAPEVVRSLAHRWFRDLHWYGLSEAPGETVLTWLTQPGGRRVRVRVAAGHFLIEAEADPEAPERPFRAARGLLSALAELYGLLPESNGDDAIAAEVYRPGMAA